MEPKFNQWAKKTETLSVRVPESLLVRVRDLATTLGAREDMGAFWRYLLERGALQVESEINKNE